MIEQHWYRLACSVLAGLARHSCHIATLDPNRKQDRLALTPWVNHSWHVTRRHAEAWKLFGRLHSRCNDVGLLAEEFDALTAACWAIFRRPIVTSV